MRRILDKQGRAPTGGKMARLGSAEVQLGASVPSSPSAVPATTVTSRHSALVRVTHWITTLCFFALLVSGIEIVISHPRFYWGETGNVLTTPLFQLPIPSSRALVPTGDLDGLGDVSRLCFRGSGGRHSVGRPAIRAYASLLRLPGSRGIPACPHRDGLCGRIPEPHGSDDYGPDRYRYGAHMSDLSRRKLIKAGLAATVGVSGLGVAARLAQKYGLVPPDHGGIYGVGETLTYASQRLLTRHSLAREFPRSQISERPLANEVAAPNEAFKRLQAGGFSHWRLSVDGLVDRPTSFSIDDLKSYPLRSQITELACEEGWSYIAEWIGAPLSHVLNLVGTHPEARYVVYFSIDPEWWESI